MIAAIDAIIDRITMYRLVLYYLIAILVVAVGLAAFNVIPYTPLGILESTGLLLAFCLITNYIFASVWELPVNPESPLITALILACILPPVHSLHDIPVLFWAGVLAMGAKFILAIRNKHLFNPAAIAVVLTGFWLGEPATWWVGTPALVWVVLPLGLLMVRKMRRYDQLFYFFVGALVVTLFAAHDPLTAFTQITLKSSLFFFAFVMLTEPLTSPATPLMQGVFGGLVGVLFAPAFHIGSLYFTPELALVTGNVFAYLVTPKVREKLTMVGSRLVSKTALEFEFQPVHPFAFQPGQYMEFTLPQPQYDARGARRFFTLTGVPGGNVKLGIKYYDNPSTFKQALGALKAGDHLLAGSIAGDFTLPRDPARKLAFVAGGIGITPYMSMLRHLASTGERRDIALLYLNKTADDVPYSDELPGLPARLVSVLTGSAPLTPEMIKAEVPDYMERLFYLSGPHPMVAGVEAMLREMGVSSKNIKKDFFPGLA